MADQAMSAPVPADPKALVRPPRPRAPGDARVLAARVAAVVILAAIYETLSRSGLFYQGIIPSLVDIAAELVELLTSTEFYGHLAVTVFEVVCGVLLGGLVGLTLGINLAASRRAGDVLHPIFLWIAPTPKIVFLLIIMLLFGLDIEAKVAKASVSAFFPVFVASFAGARQVRPVLLNVMASLNATRAQTVRHVYLPAMTPVVIGAVRLALGVAIVGTLLAEIKMANAGLGFLIIQSYNFFRIPEMYAVLAITFTLALAANAGLDRLAERLRR
tara:strand:+ start:1219 stop:2037 length:819 start_codon:yes stop_codon:yes gene_type:complete